MRHRQWLLRAALTRTLITLTATPARSAPLPRLISTAAAGGGGVAVKKVTQSNFEPTLEELRVLVRESNFVAIDLEMSGVTSAPWRETFEFDDSDVQYLKVKDSAEKFAVVQVGVCPFRWDHSKESFIAHPHNFYLFPRKELPINGMSYEFLCQTTSIDFLAKHQFDFNACIHDGISYLSRTQEAEALHNFSLAYENKSADFINNSEESVEISLVSTADILFTERMKNRFSEWRNTVLEGHPTSGRLDCNPQVQTIFFKMRPAILMDGFSSHQHKLIQLVIRKYFRDLVYVRTNDENLFQRRAVVYSFSEDDKALLMKEVLEDSFKTAQAKIKSAVGFRHVIDLLASEQKLIVGHSCILDVAHIYSKFFGPLPSTITEFASSLHKYFPHIIDTKHLLQGNDSVQRLMEKKSKSLSSVFALLCPEVSFSSNSYSSALRQHVKVEVPADMTGPSWNSGAKHEAGYDAFMTGCVFSQACSYLGVDFKTQLLSLELSKSVELKKHINLLYPNWKSNTVIDLKTGTEIPQSGVKNNKRKYPKIDFANIIILWGLPSKIRPLELKECITKSFGPESVTSVFFLDETAALVQFSTPELAAKFLLLKDSLEKNNNVISVVHPIAKLLEGGNTRAADYHTYKEICSSPASRVLFADQAEAMGIRWMTKMISQDEVVERQTETVLEGDAENSPNSFVKLNIGKTFDDSGDPHKHDSCEDILDSLFASQTFGETSK